MDPYNNANQSVVQGGSPASANPYAAPHAAVRDLQIEHLALASRLSRLGAVVLDAILISLPVSAVMIAYDDQIATWVIQPEGMSSTAGAALVVASVLTLALFVYQLWLLHRSGQTLGKKLLGIKIVRSDGSRAGLGRIIGLRYLVPTLIGMIPYVGWLFSIIDPLFIFAEDRRCLHDRIADTIVVNA